MEEVGGVGGGIGASRESVCVRASGRKINWSFHPHLVLLHLLVGEIVISWRLSLFCATPNPIDS